MMITAEPNQQYFCLPMKSISVWPKSLTILSFVIHRFLSAISNKSRPKYNTVNKLTTRPINNVTAKPRIWSVPIMYKMTAEIRVVMFESMIAEKARSNPFLIAIRKLEPRSSSSRIRS